MATDLRALAFSVSLARLLVRAGQPADWAQVSGSGWLPGLPACLLPAPGARCERQPSAHQPVILVYAADAYATAGAAARAAGLAALADTGANAGWQPPALHEPSQRRAASDEASDSVSTRLMLCPQQPLQWQGDLSLSELCDTFGEASLAWWCLTRAPTHRLALQAAQLTMATPRNPLYRVQYAGVRIDSLLRELRRRHPCVVPDGGAAGRHLQQTPGERRLTDLIDRWPVVLGHAARRCQPHRVTRYLRDLADALHSNYRENDVLTAAPARQRERARLLLETRQVLCDGLSLFGIEIPDVL